MKKFIRMLMPAAMAGVLLLPNMQMPANAAEDRTDIQVPAVEPEFTIFKQANAMLAEGDPDKVLLVMNELPWGRSSSQTALNNLGLAYDTVPISSVATIDLSQYRLVMLANAQGYPFYSTYNSVRDELEEYVEDGGSLLMGISEFGGLQSALPGGVGSQFSTEYYNHIVDTDHPIVKGSTPLTNAQLSGNYASHRYVVESSLPVKSNVILRGSSSNQATLVEYELGDGLVVASGLTWDFYYPNGFAHAFDDLIQYAYDNSDIDDQTPPDALAIATKLVEQAEANQTQANVDAAQAAINNLPAGEAKTNLQNRLDVVKKAIQIAVATQLVEEAEQTQTQESVDAAQTAVTNLPDGEAKTALQARLDAVKQTLEDIEAVEDLLDDLGNAKLTSKTGIDAAIDIFNQANKLYQELPDGDGKSALGEDIDEARGVIEQAILTILETTPSGKPYVLTGKQMTMLIHYAIYYGENQYSVDSVMEFLMPIVEGHTNLSESRIRAMVQLYMPRSQEEPV